MIQDVGAPHLQLRSLQSSSLLPIFSTSHVSSVFSKYRPVCLVERVGFLAFPGRKHACPVSLSVDGQCAFVLLQLSFKHSRGGWSTLHIGKRGLQHGRHGCHLRNEGWGWRTSISERRYARVPVEWDIDTGVSTEKWLVEQTPEWMGSEAKPRPWSPCRWISAVRIAPKG